MQVQAYEFIFWGRSEAWGSLDLEKTLSCLIQVLGNELGSLARTASALINILKNIFCINSLTVSYVHMIYFDHISSFPLNSS